ncbi:MAG: DUF721 domain-containing protein [Actinobacteria bacterium]|nr:DUF721 domain-containing protein [Actinomycetota bacterium]
MERIDRNVRRELGRFAPAGAAADTEGMVAIVRSWPAAVGETMARNAWPARFQRDGTLLVHTSSSTWAFELDRMAADVLDRLRGEVGEGAPPSLKFVPGPIPDAAAEPAEKRAPPPPPVGPGDREEGAEIAAGIEDDELREIVARAAAASLARARSDRGF